ncbi:MAG: hypothetical protein WCP53_10300 [Verrucomicrobiota bacterium]
MLREVGGWVLLPNVTGSALAEVLGIAVRDVKGTLQAEVVSKYMAPDVHDIMEDDTGWFEIVGPEDTNRNGVHFRVPTTAMDAYIRRNIEANAQKQKHLDALQAEWSAAKKAGQVAKAARLDADIQALEDRPDLPEHLWFQTLAEAQKVATLLDYKHAAGGALPIRGYRTAPKLTGPKAAEVFEATLHALENRKIRVVEHTSVHPDAQAKTKIGQKSIGLLRAVAGRTEGRAIPAIAHEGKERGRKNLMKAILKIVNAHASAKLLEHAKTVWTPTQLREVLSAERPKKKMRVKMPGKFDRRTLTSGPGGRVPIESEMTLYDFVAAKLWPDGNVPVAYRPLYVRESLEMKSPETLRLIAKQLGMSNDQITRSEEAWERGELTDIASKQDRLSGIQQVRRSGVVPVKSEGKRVRPTAGVRTTETPAAREKRIADTARFAKEAAALKKARAYEDTGFGELPELPRPVVFEEHIEKVDAPPTVRVTKEELARLDAAVEKARRAIPVATPDAGGEGRLTAAIRQAARELEAAPKTKRVPRKKNPHLPDVVAFGKRGLAWAKSAVHPDEVVDTAIRLFGASAVAHLTPTQVTSLQTVLQRRTGQPVSQTAIRTALGA